MRPYEKDPAAIYAQSFATVRAEGRLDRFAPDLQPLITRLIHACGMVEIADRLAYSPDASVAGRDALANGAPILCDCEMVAAGIIRRNLPAENPVIVTLNDPAVPGLAQSIGNTRSAAAVELWADHIEGAVVAIGNAPTALFHLLELLDAGWPKPALIIGLMAYGTYEFTSWSIMKDWHWTMVATDTLWGGALTAFSAWAGVTITRMIHG